MPGGLQVYQRPLQGAPLFFLLVFLFIIFVSFLFLVSCVIYFLFPSCFLFFLLPCFIFAPCFYYFLGFIESVPCFFTPSFFFVFAFARQKREMLIVRSVWSPNNKHFFSLFRFDSARCSSIRFCCSTVSCFFSPIFCSQRRQSQVNAHKPSLLNWNFVTRGRYFCDIRFSKNKSTLDLLLL